jgi:hypothetical protein
MVPSFLAMPIQQAVPGSGRVGDDCVIALNTQHQAARELVLGHVAYYLIRDRRAGDQPAARKTHRAAVRFLERCISSVQSAEFLA